MGIGFNIFGKLVGSPEIPKSEPKKTPENDKIKTTLTEGDLNKEEVLEDGVDGENKNSLSKSFNNIFENIKESFFGRFFNKDNKEESIVKEGQAEVAKEIIENETVQSRIFSNPLIQKVKNVDWKNFLQNQSVNMTIGALSGASKVAIGVSGGWMATASWGLVSGAGSSGIKEVLKQRKEIKLAELKKESLVSEYVVKLEEAGNKIEEGSRNLKGLRTFLKQEIERKQDNLALNISISDAESIVARNKTFVDVFNKGVTEEDAINLFEIAQNTGVISKEFSYESVENLGELLNIAREQSLVNLSFISDSHFQNELLLEIQNELKKSRVDMKRLAKSVAIGAAMGAVSAVIVGEIMERFDLHGILEEKASSFWKSAKNMFGIDTQTVSANVTNPLIKVGSMTLLQKDVSDIKGMIPSYNFLGQNIDPNENIYGYTGIARNAIKDFFNANKLVNGLINVEATPEQLLFMEDTLRRKIEEGSTELTGETISQVYELAKVLTNDQISNLGKYVDSLPVHVMREIQREESNSGITRKLSGLFATAVANAQ